MMYSIRIERRFSQTIIFLDRDTHSMGYVSISDELEDKDDIIKELKQLTENLNNAKITPADIRSTQ